MGCRFNIIFDQVRFAPVVAEPLVSFSRWSSTMITRLHGLYKMLAPALAAGLLLGLASTTQAQSFTFTTTNTSSGASMGAGTTSTITGTGSGAANLTFTNSPDSTNTLLNAPTNFVPFRIVPVFTAPAVMPPAGTTLTSNFNDTFSLTVTLFSNGGSGAVTFTGLNFTGPLTATFVGVGAPNTVNGFSFNDNVSFTLPAADLIPQVVNVGGTPFSVQLVSFTNPGNPNGQTPEGNIGGRIAAVPEPGNVALLLGMGMTGAGFLARRRSRERSASRRK